MIAIYVRKLTTKTEQIKNWNVALTRAITY